MNIRFRGKIVLVACFLGIALLGGRIARAQSTPDLRAGNFELGLYGGSSYGVDSFRPMGGVNLSYSLPKLLLPYVEFSYFPELIRNYTAPGQVFTLSASLADIHGGVHIRILPHETRIVPYAVIGFGALRSHTTGTSAPTKSSCVVPGDPATQPCSDAYIEKNTSHPDYRGTDPAVNFGAGLRYYQTSGFGYRAEFKLYRPLTGQFTKVFSKTEGGIFFQFGSR